jgi:hypothetical protein
MVLLTLLTRAEDRHMPLLSLVLTLGALVVLRTLLLAALVALTAFRTLLLPYPEWVASTASLLTMVLIMVLPFGSIAIFDNLIMPLQIASDATVLAEGGLLAIILFILALAHFLLAIATWLWRRASRLPPM